ncbi:MAG: hypothetical protein QF779_03140 [SAR324 cluster bacterium]|jgi:hypothetical protein|nr:hypothetical protein [SAR324 cluster bacterium]|tara:strand:- start:238 stop:408 length:171 start_codon:yes stop_codon:yes gene_type:complete
MALLTSIMIEELPSLRKSFRVSYLHILLPAPVVLKKTAFLLIMIFPDAWRKNVMKF